MMIRLTSAILVASFLCFSSPAVLADAMTDWQQAVVQKVRAKQGYPRLAVARQIEGRAKVRLTVAADGTISNYEIVEATGEDVLDRAIPPLIGKLSPLPPLPDGRTDLTFVLPLNWSLD
ncbi:TonB protein C-terminal [Kordiimonas lacus]|uniref:Protein TonB n=2 Tax=Kordiimonadaceae TaxID=1331809 RepID=A0A1G6UET9_9PROT|nr:TonB protein C-terminal [Kordiimonas lacus]